MRKILKQYLYLAITILLLLFSAISFSQSTRVLVRESFGNSGSATSSALNATNGTNQIGPGTTNYTYATYLPPPDDLYDVIDGRFLVANNVDMTEAYWESRWVSGRDHTGDAGGYMMIINANPGKKGEAAGQYYLYQTSAANIPGARYRISFYAGNLLRTGIPANEKNGFIGLAIRNTQNSSGQLYNSNPTWVLPRTTSNTTVPWPASAFTDNFTLPSNYTAPTLYFNFYNSDPDQTNDTRGNDLALDDILIELYIVTVSGNVFADANGNNVKDAGEGVVNGPLYAYVTKADGTIISKVQVDATTGNYVFDGDNGVPGTAVNTGMLVKISSANVAVNGNLGNPTLTGGLVYTGENVNGATEANAGTQKDGIINLTSTNANVSNLNFGLNTLPVATSSTVSVAGIPRSLNFAPGGTLTPLQGRDPEQQPNTGNWISSQTSVKSVSISSLPSNGFVLSYNGTPITTSGTTIPNFDPSLLQIAPGPNTSGSTRTTTFNFATIDAAGAVSSAVPYTINFSASLPVEFGPVNAVIKNDILKIDWQSITEKNNDHYEVEASTDGVHFTKIGQNIASKAEGGTSSSSIDYEFSYSLPTTGFFAVLFVLIGLSFKPLKRKWYHTFLIIALLASAIFFGCNKNGDDAISKSKKIYIRIVQVDKDGGKSYSKVVTAVK